MAQETTMAPTAYNFPLLPAPVAVLAFLGTAAAALALALAIAVSLATGRAAWARRLASAGLGLAGIYVLALVGFALASKEVTLARGGEKSFCEIDCHLAYSVTDVSRGAAIPGATPLAGEFWIVRLRTRFDETTISARRGREIPLTPNPRRVEVIDAAGRGYSAAAVGSPAAEVSTDLMTPLRPGESYTTTLVFDLPRDVREPRLLVREAVPEARFLIDNESSWRHRKTYFSLTH
jgi:hypothetical protein